MYLYNKKLIKEFIEDKNNIKKITKVYISKSIEDKIYVKKMIHDFKLL